MKTLNQVLPKFYLALAKDNEGDLWTFKVTPVGTPYPSFIESFERVPRYTFPEIKQLREALLAETDEFWEHPALGARLPVSSSLRLIKPSLVFRRITCSAYALSPSDFTS